MSLILSAAVLDEIRFEANYDSYDSMLMRLDPIRFRGLGQAHREVFIRHAVTVCDEWQLHFVEDVAYVMFVMSFLGSHFHQDMRYQFLRAELERTPEGADDRIERLRERFITIGARFIGPRMVLYRRDLSYFRDHILPGSRGFSSEKMLAELTASHAERSYDLHPDQRALYLRQAQMAAAGLGFGDAEGLTLSVALAYWLGTGFWKDPLYPWVAEKARQGGAGAVIDYAMHRLDRQLKTNGDLNG